VGRWQLGYELAGWPFTLPFASALTPSRTPFYVTPSTGRITFAGEGEQPDTLLRKELLQART
jgi:hypothetical protein